MADTIQNIRWAVMRPCELRLGMVRDFPSATEAIVFDAKYCSEMETKPKDGGQIFGDVAVTSHSLLGEIDWRQLSGIPSEGEMTAGNLWKYPAGGLSLSKTFSHLGGLEKIQRLCDGCPANANRQSPFGCIGFLCSVSYSSRMDEALGLAVDQLQLREKIQLLFPPSRNLWLRFWMESPVRREALIVLRPVLGAVLEKYHKESLREREELELLVAGIDCALEGGFEFQVKISPPGHTDFGWHTIFPHCPKCKTEAPLKRWRRSYPAETVVCPNCGASYSPRATASSTRMKDEEGWLREILGQANFEALATRYLEAQGATPAEASKLVTAEEARVEEIEAKRQSEMGIVTRKDAFVREVLCAGLVNHDPEATTTWLLTADDMAELLKRCADLGGTVMYLSRFCDDEDNDVFFDRSELKRAQACFEENRRENSGDRFAARIDIPQEVVDRWWRIKSGENAF